MWLANLILDIDWSWVVSSFTTVLGVGVKCSPSILEFLNTPTKLDVNPEQPFEDYQVKRE